MVSALRSCSAQRLHCTHFFSIIRSYSLRKMLFSFVLPLALLVTSGICSTVLESKEPKKGVSLPVERRQKRLQRRSEMGDATATVIGGDWTALVSFGDQDFRVIIDTGSTLLWTLSDFMTPENLAQFPNNNIYNADASPSWQPIPNLTLDVMYGDGTYGAYGVYGNENVTLGGISVTMPIGAANETVGNLLGPVDDGLLGMGFSGSGSPYITFMQSVEDQLPEFLFTLELYDDQPGSLNLGFVDDTRYTGSLQKLPIDNSANGWWVLDGVSLTSNGQNLSTRAAPFLLGSFSDTLVRLMNGSLIQF